MGPVLAATAFRCALAAPAEPHARGRGWGRDRGAGRGQGLNHGRQPRRIGFNGRPGAFADVAARRAFPGAETIAVGGLGALVAAVAEGRIDRALLPCENSLAGRVPDVHSLIPDSGLHIVGEHFQRIEHCLLAPPGAEIGRLRRVRSHPVALAQVGRLIAALGLEQIADTNTARAAERVARAGDPEEAAIASEVAAALYGLDILRRNVEDDAGNTTRFYVLAAAPEPLAPGAEAILTTILFRTRNRPGCLYEAIAGFAANGINLTRLESYISGGQFVASRFLCEFEGQPADAPVAAALAVLGRHVEDVAILGSYVDTNPEARERAL